MSSRYSPRIHGPVRAAGKRKPAPSRSLAPYPDPGHGMWKSGGSGGDWELILCGDLTDKQLDLEQQLIDVPRRSRGVVYFDSCGGGAYTGLALASLIRLRGLNATAVVAGECSSAALLPFAACATRYVSAHSTLLFHPVRWQSEEHVQLEEAVEWARHFQLLEADHDRLLAKLFGCPNELIQAWTRPGRFVMGEELVAHGLARMIGLTGGDLWTQIGSA